MKAQIRRANLRGDPEIFPLPAIGTGRNDRFERRVHRRDKTPTMPAQGGGNVELVREDDRPRVR
jgi:hypothetical protein